jgi:hypothetical protein
VVQSGFKTAHFLHVRIAVAETATLNVRLEIGAVSEQITVQGGAGQLQTESSTLGRVTDGEQIRTLPLVTRNCSQIIALNPGVAAEVTDAGHSVRDSAGPRVQDSFRMGAPSWTIISR